jgi:hypothetical protein
VNAFHEHALQQALRIVDAAAETTALGTPLDERVGTDGACAGRPVLSARVYLVLMLAHHIANLPAGTRQIAATLAERLTCDQASRLGLPEASASVATWRSRVLAARRGLAQLIDPQQSGLSEEQAAERLARAEALSTALVASSAVPGLLRALGHRGDAAIGSFFVPVTGGYAPDERRDVHGAGLYANGGSRRLGVRFGFEATVLATEIDNVPVSLGVTVHRPGAVEATPIIEHPALADAPIGTLAIDINLHGPKGQDLLDAVRLHGWQVTRTYGRDDLGIQGAYTSGFRPSGTRSARFESNEFVLIEGAWHLAFVPQRLVDANRLHEVDFGDGKRIGSVERDELLAARRRYQLTPIGAPIADGGQQYRLPDPAGYLPVNPVTGEFVGYPTAKTVTIPVAAGRGRAQRYPYRSPEWDKAWSARRAIERVAAGVRGRMVPQRGYLDTVLAVACALAADNLRAIDRLLRDGGDR